MFLKLESGFFINLDQVTSIEIWDMNEVSEGKETGFGIFFILNCMQELYVKKHICEDEKNCDLDKEVSTLHRICNLGKEFDTEQEAETWIQMNLPILQINLVH